MMQGNGSFGGFDLQGPLRVHHHHHQQNPNRSSMVPPTIHQNFPLTIRTNQDCDQTVSLIDFNNKPDRGKSGSDDDEPSFAEDCGDNRDQGKGKKPSSSSSTWQRVKWTDNMVRMLITAVSYITEDVAAAETSNGLRKKYSNLQKKGKWKSVSKVMAERGHFVSPQQCEDKFNDLNKRYKRLNEILGRGTSCEVVENPALLDVMDHVPEKAKDEVRKILSSKHLHYEEMCSYHNGNRLHLPPDPELHRSLRMALHSRDDLDEIDAKKHPHDEENDEVDQDSTAAELESSEENHHHTFPGNPAKRIKPTCGNDHFNLQPSFKFPSENEEHDGNQGPSDGQQKSNAATNQHRHLQLEEQRIHLDMQKMELEKERFKWQRFCRKKDRELEIMKMEIERMKLENERMALELRRKELGMDSN